MDDKKKKELAIRSSAAEYLTFVASTGESDFDRFLMLEQPNEETMAAMLEAERIARDPSVKGYSDIEEAFRSLKE